MKDIIHRIKILLRIPRTTYTTLLHSTFSPNDAFYNLVKVRRPENLQFAALLHTPPIPLIHLA